LDNLLKQISRYSLVDGVRRNILRAVIVTLLCIFGYAQNTYAQTNTDEGLPPGWETWADSCGKTGQRDACYNEATRLYWGAGGMAVDKAKAADFMVIACKYNDIDSCRRAIRIARDEIYDVKAYGKALDAGCLLNEIVFCNEAFQFYSGYGQSETFTKLGNRSAFNPGLALAYANAACKKGGVFGCNQIGRAFSPNADQRLGSIPANNSKSLDGYIQACRLKSVTGCYLAFHNSDGEDGLPLVQKIREEALKRGCELSIVGMCKTQIAAYLYGEKGTPKNRSKAIALMEAGCLRLDDELCAAAGRTYLDAESPTVGDIEAGLKQMEKGCRVAQASEKKERCGEAAYYLSIHLGETHQRTDSIAYAGCESGSAAACIIRGNNARAEGKNDVFIRDAYQKACDLGHSDGCTWAKELTDSIAKAASDDPLKVYRDLCNSGHKESCDYLELYRKTMEKRAAAKAHNAKVAAKAAEFAKRRLAYSSCPRASCERRSWSEYLKDERATARARNKAWHKSGGYSSTPSNSYAPSGTPITPFGNSARSQRNWRVYKNNLRCGNPTASGC